jgi:beta-lactamase regulating signal transducer with metallopeptidase domain
MSTAVDVRGSHHFPGAPYPGGVNVLANLDVYISLVIWLVGIPVGLYAFVHALLQRADAFAAADKLSKPAWLGITGASLLVLVLFRFGDAGTILWLAGLVAVLVYIVDVRPRVTEVQRGPRW